MQNSKSKIIIDARFVGSGSALGRYSEQLLINLLPLSDDFEIRSILHQAYKKDIPAILKKNNPIWVGIDHYSIAEQTKLLWILKKEKADLIHYTHFNAPIFSPRPFVMTMHDLTISRFRDKNQTFIERAAYNFLLKQVAKKADHFIAISNATKKDLEKFLNVNKNKVSVIYEGIENKFRPEKPEIISKFKQAYKIDFPYVMYAGQWRPHKNLINLFEAFAILKKEYHIPEKLVLFGKLDSRYPEIPAKIKELNLEKEIILLGFIPDDLLPAAYSGANLYVIPSLAEGFGFPPLEAAACGTPVASSLISCMPEVLGEAAVFFDPYDPRDIAVKINSALTNQKLREVLIERGFNRVKRYNWEKTAEETLRVYENILQN
ncbi:MAG: glycosyltransferase family 1 protein [Patescibacteria group bacterium]|nr:glycosyltransferase family 1 protein [Patescibacteria group bacterium]